MKEAINRLKRKLKPKYLNDTYTWFQIIQALQPDKKICTICKKEKSIDDFYLKYKNTNQYMAHCKICDHERNKEYTHTVMGLTANLYRQQRSSSRERSHPMPNYTLKELRRWLAMKTNFSELYKNWVKSDYKRDLRPSLDRLYDDLPYTLDNIRLVTWKENHDKKRNYANK